jgi:hypothetical protein
MVISARFISGSAPLIVLTGYPSADNVPAARRCRSPLLCLRSASGYLDLTTDLSRYSTVPTLLWADDAAADYRSPLLCVRLQTLSGLRAVDITNRHPLL